MSGMHVGWAESGKGERPGGRCMIGKGRGEGSQEGVAMVEREV